MRSNKHVTAVLCYQQAAAWLHPDSEAQEARKSVWPHIRLDLRGLSCPASWPAPLGAEPASGNVTPRWDESPQRPWPSAKADPPPYPSLALDQGESSGDGAGAALAPSLAGLRVATGLSCLMTRTVAVAAACNRRPRSGAIRGPLPAGEPSAGMEGAPPQSNPGPGGNHLATRTQIPARLPAKSITRGLLCSPPQQEQCSISRPPHRVGSGRVRCCNRCLRCCSTARNGVAPAAYMRRGR